VSAIGALRAFEEAGRADTCAVMGQNASPEGRSELRQPNTRFVGSVAFFPERYGPDLVRVSLDILNKKPVPSGGIRGSQTFDSDHVDHFYPNDGLLQNSAAASTE
jgi:ribose transport system substrate-binding protein